METKEAKTWGLEVPVGTDSIRSFIRDLDGTRSRDDALSIEVSCSEQVGDEDTFTLLDSEGFPLLTVTLRPES